MPRYFFDTDDGDFRHQDNSGQDLPGLKAARDAAISELPDMARDKLPDGDRRDFYVRVRDESGQALYSASLSFAGEWHVTPPVS